jgi:hypothetical protein
MRIVPTVQDPFALTTERELAIRARISTQPRAVAMALSATTAMNVHPASSSVVRRQNAGLCNRQLLPPRTRSVTSAAATAAAVVQYDTVFFRYYIDIGTQQHIIPESKFAGHFLLCTR